MVNFDFFIYNLPIEGFMIKKFKSLLLAGAMICVLFPASAKKISEQRQTMITSLLTMLGTPYYWGGKTPSPGIDCSGLIAYCARKSIKVNYTGNAQTMYNSSTKIENKLREPGDLLFFSESNSPRNITHIGVYLGKYPGAGKFKNKHIFIHSASDGSETGVICSSIDESNYWTKHYVGAGRFLPSTASASVRVKKAGGQQKVLQSSKAEFENDPWWDDVDISIFDEE